MSPYRVLALGLACLLPTVQAATLRLYPNFAELRQNVKVQDRTLELSFSQSQLEQMIGGSMYLKGPRALSRLQTATPGISALERFEGQTVYLREDGRVRPVRLIRASSGTVQDLATGRYRSGITVDQLEFTTPLLPETPEQVRYRYALDSSQPAVLSYLTRALSWSPRYVLNVQDSGSRLEAWADLRNNGEALRVDSSELIAGQVELVGTNPGGSGMVESQMFLDDSRAAATKVMPTAPTVGSGQEQQGLSVYRLSKGYTLPKNSLYSLPFLNPQVSVQRVARLETYFNSGFSRGKLERLYRLKSNVALPAGALTVRDADRVVGSQGIPDLTRNEAHDLRLGADPDLSFTRSVQSSTSSKTKIFGAVQRTYTTTVHQVRLNLKNSKARAVAFEVLERLSGQNIAVSGQASRTAQGLGLNGTLPARGTLERQYTVTVTQTGPAVPVPGAAKPKAP